MNKKTIETISLICVLLTLFIGNIPAQTNGGTTGKTNEEKTSDLEEKQKEIQRRKKLNARKKELNKKLKKLKKNKKNLMLQSHRLRVKLIQEDPELNKLHKKIVSLYKELGIKIDQKEEMGKLIVKDKQVTKDIKQAMEELDELSNQQ